MGYIRNGSNNEDVSNFIDTDSTLSSNSNIKSASVKAVKTYIDNNVSAFQTNDGVMPSSNIYILDMKGYLKRNFSIEISDVAQKTIEFTNIPSSTNKVLSILVELKYFNEANIVYPEGTIWYDNNIPSLVTGKQYLIQFISYNNGNTWMANIINKINIDNTPVDNTYNITFTVTDGINPVSNATINILNQILTTNVSGISTLTNVNPANDIVYTISKAGFITSNGNITVTNQNITQNITLTELPTYNVVFTVTDGTNPIDSTTVTISGQNLITDSNGVATATGLNTGNNIAYSISKAGYNTLSSTLNVVDQNIMQNVVLMVTSSFDIATKQPKVILSLVKINSNYTGACLNVRRNSDNTTQDIGYVNGYLDVEALTNFVGQGNGYVTKWYDSSGNGNDFIQATNANQPRIVNNGIPEDGLWFAGSTTNVLTLAPNSTVNNLDNISILSQYKPISKNVGVSISLISKSQYWVSFYDNINALYVAKNYSSSNASFYRDPGGIKLSQWNDLAVTYNTTSASNSPKIYADGVVGSVVKSLGSGTPTDDSSNSFTIGRNLQGNVKSIIVCNSILSDSDIADERTLINSIMPSQLTSNVTFTVTDGTNPISEATVTFDGNCLQSDTNGLVTFNNVNYGLNQSYTISKTGYYTITNTINVNRSEITQNINMVLIPSEFNVTFTITDGVNVITDASIAFNSITLTTNASGTVTFNNVHVGTDIPYTISKTSYRDTTGTLDVVDSALNPTIVLSTLSTVATNAYYVSPNGLDSNDGLTVDTPFLTLQRAQTEARIKTASGLTQDCYIYLREGEYNFTYSWEFLNQDSGTNGHKIIYKNYNNEIVQLTGSKALTGWSLYNTEKNIYVVDTPVGYTDRRIYEGDKILCPAKFPNIGYNRVAQTITGYALTKFGFNEGDIPVISNINNLQVFMWAGGATGTQNWNVDVIDIIDIDYTNHIVTLASNASSAMGAGSRYWIQKASELLDTPGEYYFDNVNNKLYVIPIEAFAEDKIKIPNFSDYLIAIDRSGNNTVENLQFEGLIFKYISGSAFFILKSSKVNIINCIINAMSSHAIYSQENKDCIISGNHVYNIGGDGIVINGKALSSTQTSSGNNITNNEIHDIGITTGQSVGVNLDSADNCTVTHNRIYNSPRWAISFGGKKVAQLVSQTIGGIVVTSDNVSQFRHGVNNIIEYNDCFNCNTDSEDTSPIYSYGAGDGNIVRYNSIHDSGVPFGGGYGIYLDDGADGTLIDSNIMYNMQLFDGGEYRGLIIKGLRNIAKNNIIADSPSCKGALVPSSSTDPVGSMKFYNNIVYNSGNIMYDMYGITDLVTESNYNTFYSVDNQYLVYRNSATSVEDLRLGTYLGTYDQNSVEENPLFINAYPNDYRLKYNSSARGMGNVDIDFGSIGLTSSYIYADNLDDIDKVFVTTSKAGFEPNIDLNLGEQTTLSIYLRTVNGYYMNTDGATVNITSDNSTIASVLGNNITANQKGIATITISVTKNSITKSTKIYILIADTFKSISILSPYSRLSASWNDTGKTKFIPICRSELGRIYNASLGTILFSSADTSKVTITENGVATIIGDGDVDILVNGTFAGIQKSGSVTINALLNDYASDNLVQNGDMENDLAVWQTSFTGGANGNISYDNTIFDTGARSLKMTINNAPTNGSQTNAQLFQNNISVIANTKYRFVIDSKSIPNLQFWVYADVGLSTSPFTNDYWNTYSYDFKSPSTKNMTLFLQTGRNNGTFWFDNIGIFKLNNYRCPDSPTAVSVTDNSISLDISWTASITSGIQGYNIYINGVKDNVSLITETNYTSTVATNINYYIQVSSIDLEGNESFKTSAIEIKRL
jgi:hypothetical protein